VSEPFQLAVADQEDTTVRPLRTDQDAPDIAPHILNCNRASKAHEKLYSRVRQSADIANRARHQAEEAQQELDAADTEHEAIQAEDPDRRAPRTRQLLIVGAALAADGAACYFAAEALGSSQPETIAWAALFLALLAVAEVTLDHFSERHPAAWRWIAVGLAGFVGLLGILRYSFLATVGAAGFGAALVGSVLFTMATAGFVLIGYRALRLAETTAAWRARKRVEAKRRAVAAAQRQLRQRIVSRDSLASAYLSRVRLHLIQMHGVGSQRQTEQAIWAHLTSEDTR
jgi:hypothetical protein